MSSLLATSVSLAPIIARQKTLMIGDVAIDAVESETHERAYEITQHAVEVGADIADHKRRKADRLRITGTISDTPLGARPLAEATILFTSSVGIDDAVQFPSEAAFQSFLLLQASADPITIITSLGVYRNVLFESLRVDRTPTESHELKFTGVFVEYLTVESVTVTQAQATRAARQGEKALGRVPTKTAPTSAAKQLGQMF